MSNELIYKRNKLKRSLTKAKKKMMEYASDISKATDVPSDSFNLLHSALIELKSLQSAINATHPEANEVDIITNACKRSAKQKKSRG